MTPEETVGIVRRNVETGLFTREQAFEALVHLHGYCRMNGETEGHEAAAELLNELEFGATGRQ